MPHKIFFCFLLLISLAFGANDDAREIGKAVSDIEHLQKNYEKLDDKIDEMEKNQKSVEEYKNAIADQNSRIQDLSFYNSWLAIIVGIWTLATTILLVFLAFKWKKEATAEAKEAAEMWLQENADKKISDKLKEFDDYVKSNISNADIVIDEKMKEIEKDIKQRIDAIYKDYKKVMKLFEEVRKANGDIKRLDEVQADESTIDEALRQAEARAKSTNKDTDWFEAAMLASKQKNYEKAIVFWDKAIAVSDNNTSKAICLFNKGVTLGQQNKTEEEIKTYDKLYEEFGTSQNEEIRVQVAMALFNKGVTLGQQNKTEEAIKTYDKAYKEFGTSQNEEIRVQVANALFNKGVTLGQQNKTEEAIKTYDKVYKEFGTSQNEEIRVQVAKALYNKGVALGQQNKTEEEIKTYDKLYEEFGSSQNEEIRIRVAKALYNKGVALGQQNKTEEEIKTYDKLYEEFGASQNEEIRVLVASALVGKGFRLGQQDDNKGAKEQYLKSIEFNPSYLDAYTNLFEIWLIMGDEFDEKIVSQFLENARENRQTLLLYEMLSTLKASLLSNQSEKIKELKDKYSSVGFGDWGWKELEAWTQNMADVAASARVLEAISEFKRFE